MIQIDEGKFQDLLGFELHPTTLKFIMDAIKECTQESVPAETLVMPENLRALERLTAKQALEIDDLKIRLADNEERIKDVMLKITCIGAPLNDNYYQYNKEQLKIFFEIQQILSE